MKYRMIISLYISTALFSHNYSQETELIKANYTQMIATLQQQIQTIQNTISNNNTGFAASYGQLSITAQSMTFNTADTPYAIPFTATGPSSNMSVTTDYPATITIEQNGVYQINISLYISIEAPMEGSFNPSTYTLSLQTNDSLISIGTIAADNPGSFNLNYNTLVTLSANDQIQFLMQTSDVQPEGPMFNNRFVLQNTSANVIQIAN